MYRRIKIVRWLQALVLASVLWLALTGCGGAPRVDWELNITGNVGNPITVTYADLAKMEQIELADLLMEKSMGEDEVHSWSGASLDAILAQAEAGDLSGGITGYAADGYAVDIPQEELKGAIVALKKDGAWITEAEPDKAPIRLVCPETPANRWIFQIAEIEVK
ncbi:MAG: molybdopterin-dependent oxidoreductase [Anaerolineae bacterium]|nr:molybdopterin-dependent oxidoreductase [Anaerolineae bacterium]